MNSARASARAFRSDAEGWREAFAAIDSKDAGAFAAFFTADGEFRFGNGDPVTGPAAIEAAVAGFFAAIGGCRHELVQCWTPPGAAICEGRVTYTRLDGGKVTLPFTNVLTVRDGGVASYRIYIDNGPLFATPAGAAQA